MERRMEESGRFFFNPSSHADIGGSWSATKMEESLKRRASCMFSGPQSDEEYYEEQSSSDKKRRLTSQQVDVLERSFSGEKKVEAERRKELASNLGLHPRQVAVWFQNRRARWKAKQLERDYDELKSSHDYLLSHYNFILKQNQKLKAEVTNSTVLATTISITKYAINVLKVNLLSKKLEGNCKEVDDDDEGKNAPPSRMKAEKKCDFTRIHSSIGHRDKIPEEEYGNPKQELLMDNYYYYCVCGSGNTYNNLHNIDYEEEEEDMDHHVCNSTPHAQTTTDDDEPLGWFWS
ncbi:PREDICTED: homeobox-leucine zipper protein ATHB-53-like isoform X2 [Ipomoea nil]|uniref:homeobox-leucine zipper protein ATHB-53-like isoform X2 n=1 Tax=Ipomoea nil TaxID=35883 RepID=UPI00090092EE|nr:PREDICTED: homeobox-leucine zipper protein ATHB-53-like isoform X2 [Ipomoea nil]